MPPIPSNDNIFEMLCYKNSNCTQKIWILLKEVESILEESVTHYSVVMNSGRAYTCDKVQADALIAKLVTL
jgi:hypothetical protein